MRDSGQRDGGMHMRTARGEVARPVSGEFDKPLTRVETRRMASDFAAQRGIDPEIVERFLSPDSNEPSLDIEKYLPQVLFAAYLVTNVMKAASPELLGHAGLDIEIGEWWHNALNGVHDIGNNTVNEPTVAAHMPYVFLEASIATGFARISELLRSKTLEKRKEEIRAAQEAGELRYKMAEGHTALFSVGTSALVDILDKKLLPNELMVYSKEKTGLPVWQKISSRVDQRRLYASFDRADLQGAGEIVLSATNDAHMFLQQPGHEKIDIDGIVGMIETVDDYCEDREIPHKPIIIVGDRHAGITRVQRDVGNGEREYPETLEQRVEMMNIERKKMRRHGKKGPQEIELIDPTDIVLEKIVQLAGGRPIVLATTSHGSKEYGAELDTLLQERGYFEKEVSGNPVYLRYDISDAASSVERANINPKDEIVVVVEREYKQRLVRRGVPEGNIVIVEDLLGEYIQNLVNQQ